MNQNNKDSKPFAFRLAEQSLPAEENQEENIQPLSNRTIFLTLIGIVLIVLFIRFVF